MTGRNKLTNNPLIGILIIAVTVFGIKFASAEKSTHLQEESAVKFTEVKKPVNVLHISEKFNPNDLSEEDWQQIGFTAKQAKTIVKYREVVGGNFESKEQLKKCYAIPEETYSQIKDFIMLPEKASTNFSSQIFKPKTKSLVIPGRFNPDHYQAADWQKLGFSDKQAHAILKYRDYLGGSFISKEKFRECFIISAENYTKLAPYLILPQHAPQQQTFQKSNDNKIAHNGSKKTVLQTFDPNELDAKGWQKLGFSEKQSAVIINYRNTILKGQFKNLEQIEKCFVISAEKFAELKPYIQIAEQPISQITQSNLLPKQVAKTDFSNTDLNEITFRELVEFGFTEKAAASYLGFRKNLGGFVSKNQIFEVYGIDREVGERLVQTLSLNTDSVQKYNLSDAPESWLKTHPYFKYSADKIIYYRVTYPDDKKIWKFLNTKPEYLAKMKLYLK